MPPPSTWNSFIDFMVGRGNIDQLMIVSAENGEMWASSDPEGFYLREYLATITQEDGSEREETVNEAANIVLFMKGQKPFQGLRINGTKKQQITRSFKDEVSGLPVLYGKFPQGGSCVASGGKCIIIGTFHEAKGHASPLCNETVTLVATYLSKSVWPNRKNGEMPSGAGAPSWDVYLNTMLIGKGNISEALIFDDEAGKILAATTNFGFKTYEAEIAQEDGTDKVESINEQANLIKLMRGTKTSQGLRINQVKYQVIRSLTDENSTCYTVHGKKSMGGVGLVKCPKCILVATFDETKGHTAPGCHTVMADLAKYLKDSMG
mmetsp:Transcript_32773/g.55254  ORF Transcript_32773/g.55254 Transcript_32773/m.55254 type:complete len:321 (+) Transcript_32773:86-1048(+)